VHNVILPDWAIDRGRVQNDVRSIDGRRTAFVAIDMQNVFMNPDEVFGNPNTLDIVDTVNAGAKTIRDAGGLVIWTRQTTSTEPPLAMPPWQYDMSIDSVRIAVDAMRPGTRSQAVHDAMDVRPDDLVLDKYRYSAFMCPANRLRDALAGRDIDTLVIAGTLTNCCCDSTARDGNMMGYRIVFLSDATSTITDAEHNAALLNVRLMFGDVKRSDELPALIAAARPETVAA
jgi:nicotinamidase-related amidase